MLCGDDRDAFQSSKEVKRSFGDYPLRTSSFAAYFAPGVQVLHVVRGAVAHAAVNCAVV
jgi:hypothetical protein